MSLQIPLSAVPAQTLNVVLGLQKCSISLYQRGEALYCDLFVNGQAVVLTRACRNKIRLLLDAQYHGFLGDLVIVDTQGDTQPTYLGLGARYILLYLSAAEIA